VSLFTLGVCLAVGLYHHWYVWIPVAGLAIFYFAELPLTFRDKTRSATNVRNGEE
jgi:hypothetical protein